MLQVIPSIMCLLMEPLFRHRSWFFGSITVYYRLLPFVTVYYRSITVYYRLLPSITVDYRLLPDWYVGKLI